MRRVTVGTLLLLVLIPLAGCSGSDGASAVGGAGKASSGEGAGAAAASGNSGSGSKATGTSRGGDSTASEAGPAVTRKLPQARTDIAYDFSTGGAGARSRFAAATRPLKSVYSSVRVFTATTGGVAKADVAVYAFPAGTAKDPRFQGQIVSQLVSTSTGITKLRYEALRGHSAAVAQGKVAAVGYFDAGKAVVVLSRAAKSGKAGVSAAADVAYSYSK